MTAAHQGPEPVLAAGDVFLTRGQGFLSRAIRFFTRGIGESRTKANHVGLVVVGGPLREAIVVEALSRVKRHGLAEHYAGTSHEVAVFRPLNVSESDLASIVAAAETYVDRKYAWWTVVWHLLDWCLLGAYVFRRLSDMGDYPICSWLVAHAFAKVGLTFGVEPGAASPDDIWDFATGEPERYARVRELARIAAAPAGHTTQR